MTFFFQGQRAPLKDHLNRKRIFLILVIVVKMAANLDVLPADVIDPICEYLSTSDIRFLRLTCKSLEAYSLYKFKKAFKHYRFEITRPALQRLREVASQDDIANAIRSLEITWLFPEKAMKDRMKIWLDCETDMVLDYFIGLMWTEKELQEREQAKQDEAKKLQYHQMLQRDVHYLFTVGSYDMFSGLRFALSRFNKCTTIKFAGD